MKRLLLLAITAAVAAALALPVSASAETQTHQTFSFSADFTAPAGTFCDFTFRDTFTGEFNLILFGDPNNPTKIIQETTEFVTHFNLDTGYTLTEVDHFTAQFRANTGRTMTVGLVWHLRDPSGKLVVVHAGEMLFDFITGEVLKVTPNFGPQGAAVICPALGGHPAI